jgi:hypothetical protein
VLILLGEVGGDLTQLLEVHEGEIALQLVLANPGQGLDQVDGLLLLNLNVLAEREWANHEAFI